MKFVLKPRITNRELVGVLTGFGLYTMDDGVIILTYFSTRQTGPSGNGYKTLSEVLYRRNNNQPVYKGDVVEIQF